MSRKNTQKTAVTAAETARNSAPTVPPPATAPAGEAMETALDGVPTQPPHEPTAPADIVSAGDASEASAVPPPTEPTAPGAATQDPALEEPPAADPPDVVEAPADEEPVIAVEPGVGDVLGNLDFGVPPIGYIQRKPSPRLSPKEAETQALLFAELQKRGVPVRDQGGVYPWLLRQLRAAVDM